MSVVKLILLSLSASSEREIVSLYAARSFLSILITMAFPLVLARVNPKLRDWVVRRSLLPTDITELFSAEELGSGAALAELEDELQVDGEDVEVFERDFWELLAACGHESRRQHARLAAVPIWKMHLEAQAKKLRLWKESELDRLDAAEALRGRQVPPPPPANPRYGTSRRRGAALEGDGRAREKAEETERNKWLGRLQTILDALDTTSRQESGCRDDRRLVRALAGGRRASTLRARVRTWEQYRRWLRAARSLEHPRSAGDFVDYLFDRAEEPCGRGVLRGAYDMLRFAEEMIGTPKADRLSELTLVKSSLKGLISEAAAAGPKNRGGQAPRPFVAIIGMLEELVVRDGEPLYSRLLAWWVILSTWGILRFDDHKGSDYRRYPRVGGPMGVHARADKDNGAR